MSKPLALALVSREYPPFYGGGIGTYARWIVPALAEAGVRVHVVTEAHDDTEPRVKVEGSVTVHRVPLAIGRGGWTSGALRFSINAGRKVHELARRGEIDVAEFAECEAAATALLLLRRPGQRIPTIVHLHTPSEMLFVLRSLSSKALDESLASYFLAERLALRLSDRIGVPSRFIANWAVAHYELAETPTVIPYAIPAADAVRPPPPPARTPTVLYVGRIEPRKGVEPLVLAWKRIQAKHPDARLRLAGADTAGAPESGSMRAYLNDLLDPHERASVQFLGRLRPKSLQEEYARAVLCVVPSLWENFPNTCIEAMLNSRAVAVADHGGMIEMIEGTDAGLTFTAGDPDALATAVSRLLDEGLHSLAERGAVARNRIAVLCDPSRVAGRRIGLYRDTIERAYARQHASASDTRRLLHEWKRAEQAAHGSLLDMELPDPGGAITRWVERREGMLV